MGTYIPSRKLTNFAVVGLKASYYELEVARGKLSLRPRDGDGPTDGGRASDVHLGGGRETATACQSVVCRLLPL